MAHEDQNRIDANWRLGDDALGRVLDAALSKYADVEPRPGLEDRVLANLRTEHAQVSDRTWWHWSLVGAMAAVLVVSLAVAWRSGKPSQPLVAIHRPEAAQAAKEPTPQVVSNDGGNGVRPAALDPARKIVAHRPHPPVTITAQPKLDQFPSPQPPSQQELALRRYVSQFPQEATLIARAQEEYEKEIQQQMKDPRSQTESDTSDQQER